MKRKKVLIVVLIILALLVSVIAGGFTYLYFNGMTGIANNTDAQGGQIKVACVGDSVTYGHGISNWPKNNYPTVLQNLLGESYHVNSYGVPGRAVQSDSDQPYTALEHYQKSLDYDADYVVFMMGSNDSKPENWHGADAFQAELLTLLDSYGDAHIILCTPPSAFFTDGQTEGVTSHDIQPKIVDEIADICRQIAENRDYTLLDIHTMTAEHPDWFEKDGVHPSNDGAAAIAKAVADILRAQS